MIDQETLYTFDELYEKTFDEISQYVVCHCQNINDVEDLLQIIYIEVSKNISSIHNVSYIYGIAKHKIKDYYRFRYKNKLLSLFNHDEQIIENIPDDINIEESYTLQYDMDCVWEYLSQKPIIISQIFYLYYYSGLTIKDIALKLHTNESNVKNYLYRTLKELRIYLRSEENE